MKNALVKTDFKFPGQKSVYHGKVRDVYNIDDELLVMVVSDRISAFDVILPEGIPYKGQVLNQIAAKFLDATSDIVPNWKVARIFRRRRLSPEVSSRKMTMNSWRNIRWRCINEAARWLLKRGLFWWIRSMSSAK